MNAKLQPRELIPVELGGEKIGIAVKNGNNAAWMCACGYRLPLIWSGHFALVPMLQRGNA